MPNWLLSIGGLLVWTAHFFGLYLAASIWLGSSTARVAGAMLTVACLVANAWIVWRTAAAGRTLGVDPADHWLLTLALLGAGFSALAVLWQGLPVLIV